MINFIVFIFCLLLFSKQINCVYNKVLYPNDVQPFEQETVFDVEK
jgi:hypothetical protein